MKRCNPRQSSEFISRRGLRVRRRKGAAAVEFAVVAPLFLLFLLGIFEFGRMVMVQQTLTTAAREGARRAVVEGVTSDEAKATVESYLASAGISGAAIVVDPDPPGSVTHGNPVAVSVSIPFSQVSWLPAPFFLGEQTLASTATMRRETPH